MLPAVSHLPHAPGVYRFRDGGGRVLRRAMMVRIEDVEAAVCDSAHEAAWLERNLLEARRPSWNRSRGEESPVYVRLDGRLSSWTGRRTRIDSSRR